MNSLATLSRRTLDLRFACGKSPNREVYDVILSLYALGARSDEPEILPPDLSLFRKKRNYCNQRHMCIMYVICGRLRYISGKLLGHKCMFEIHEW